MLMFAAYYCLNISYRSELGATLMLMFAALLLPQHQLSLRTGSYPGVLAEINPDKGTKVERKE
ncbi:hypothetical protein F7725_007651 [Dissostichus mawsoni]|uniref:Uncharacterized protein n=1 Tax=Dissostichus mawsoni TaxID=36200 RepID=A0A7J5Y823_DISMA|nr:hypothetical protein F7725_007651 [Dissostichus mawsoni]